MWNSYRKIFLSFFKKGLLFIVIQIVYVEEFPSPDPEWVTLVMLVSPQSCPTFCSPKDCSPSDSSDHGILQTRILEWIIISFSRGSFWPRYWTWVSCIAGRFFTFWATTSHNKVQGTQKWVLHEPLSQDPIV